MPSIKYPILPEGVVFDPVKHTPYHYIPSESIAVFMLILFGLSTIVHTGQAIYYKNWFIFPTVFLCCVMELGGWGARLYSHFDPSIYGPFKMQMCLTIIAPTPLLAGTFVIFGAIIRRLGFQYSRLSPKLYMIVFCTCDFASLIIQGVGGAMAASAVGKEGKDPEKGAHIMLGGIGFQLLTITIYTICTIEYVYRYIYDLPLRPAEPLESNPAKTRGTLTDKLKIMLGALGLSTVCLFIRAIYRTVELIDGWSGPIISTEIYFIVLDGVMIVMGVWIINFVHPGLFLAEEPESTWDKEKLGSPSYNSSNLTFASA